MKCLFDILKTEPDYTRLLKDVQKGDLPIAASGLSEVHKAIIISALSNHTDKKLFVLVSDEPAAVSMQGDLNSLGVNSLILHGRDYNLTRMTGYSKEYEHKRVDTLSRVLDRAFDVVLIPVDSAVQYTVSPEILTKNIISLFCVSY